MAEEVKATTLDELKAKIAAAATSGDDVTFNTLIREYNSRKADIAKAIAAAAEKEAAALAGVREKLATKLHAAIVKIPNIAAELEDVKATGFTFKLDEPNGVSYKSVALSVPTVKAARKAGGAGGTHTSSKAEFGMTLDEIFKTYATAEDQSKYDAIEAGAAGNSARWQVKNAVKKAAIAAGKLSPAK